MKLFFIIFLCFLCKNTREKHHIVSYTFSGEDIAGLKDIFNLILLKLMFEEKLYTNTNIFDKYFIQYYEKKDYAGILNQTNQYVYDILFKKKKLEKNNTNIRTQKVLLKEFENFAAKQNINDATISEIKKIFDLKKNKKLTSEFKDEFCKEIFYIFIQEFQNFIAKSDLFYRNAISFMQTFANHVYYDVENDETKIINFTSCDFQSSLTNNEKNYFFIDINALEFVYSGYRYIFLYYYKKYTDENIVGDELFYKTLESYESNQITADAEKDSDSLFFDFDKIQTLRRSINANKKNADFYYSNYYDDNIILDSIEFWCRDFCNSNEKHVKILKDGFLKTCKSEFPKLKDFLYKEKNSETVKYIAKKEVIYIFKTKKNKTF